MVYSTAYTSFADTSSVVPEDGFDDFEFAKYLEDIVHLKRSKSMPASRISGIVEKACNECFFCANSKYHRGL